MHHTVVATQLKAKRKYTVHWYTCSTQQLQRYATFTAVHNTYMTQKHLVYLKVVVFVQLTSVHPTAYPHTTHTTHAPQLVVQL